MTATGRKPTMHLALPPRIAMTRTDSGDSAPSTPGPHTPLPYDFAGYFNGPPPLVTLDTIDLDESSPIGLGSKRSRDEEDEQRSEPEWTEEEIDVIQTVLIHPFRPVSTSYPPGELPPPKVLDELTNQILNYAFRQTHSSPPSDPSSSPTYPSSSRKWTHSFTSTRKKLFDLALSESKLSFGFADIEEKKKLSREERIHSGSHGRPGLRRVDSMDFLDHNDDNDDEEFNQERKQSDNGRAARLSTSLQNSAKQEPLLSLSRSTSVGSGLIAETPLFSTGPIIPPALPIAAITLTPASPTGPSPSKSQPLRRKPSLRNLSARPSRPTSLLQRGRSFTAEDLRAEAESNPSSDDKLSSNDDQPQPIISPTSSEIVSSPQSIIPPSLPSARSPGVNMTKLTRSHSSSSILESHSQPHAIQKMFLQNPKPSTTDRSILALPLPIDESPSSSSQQKSSSGGGGWSDSEDESLTTKQPRKIKKLKQNKNRLNLGGGLDLKGGPPIMDQQLLLPETVIERGGLGLRSPFEEKDEPQFM